MSPAAIIAIAVGGILLVAVAIVVMMVFLRRSYNAQQQGTLSRLNEEIPRRGWTYEERNDSYVSVFNSQNEYAQRPLIMMPNRQNPLAPLNPYHLPPRADQAHKIITGTHRGRPFIAALFRVHYAGKVDWNTIVWVRTARPGPALSVSRSIRLESHVRRGLGQGDVQYGNPDFDAQYQVSAEDERFARAVLNPAVMQYMLTEISPLGPSCDMWLLGDHIDLSDPMDDHRDPLTLIPALDRRCDLLDRIPQSAWA
ncbi:DUF3137 domain-containing protein [Kutzneria sp. CA-103260]|uniref:DUF3137 domain-containing protein n=1 Tax=Kutzneria sp. CA-103260 TaxID=2802641 RepID=UPI001BA8B52D|nr:DUF3137 domain-containing protein [Kutzneria sp. CA-103260]QUQ69362.1 hypothetical protein JJ691_71200 [Kutzneria sp. CA-103260]